MKDFMKALSNDNQADIIKAFNLVTQIYLPELQLNKTNTSDTQAPFLDLHLSISNGF